jgi:transposase
VRATGSAQFQTIRARIILMASRGSLNEEIAATLEIPEQTVGKWRRRFCLLGMRGLEDSPRSGRPLQLAPEKINRVLTEVTKPPSPRSRWSIRSMARHAGISKSHVQSIWSRNDIKPHVQRTFKLSRDPNFEPKFWDIIGLYLNPPHKAVVLCCDEKSQCQALERTQPGLPLGIGHVCTATHDYIRHGTMTLFAALSYLDGKIISQAAQRHTHAEWLKFLKHIDQETPQDLELHLVIDNYATHKHPKVLRWLKKHPRFHMHFTPTSSSWMNMVERFFRDLSEDVVRNGSFESVKELSSAILSYLAERNLNPKAYQWKAQGAEILAKIQRAREKLASIQQGTYRSAHSRAALPVRRSGRQMHHALKQTARRTREELAERRSARLERIGRGFSGKNPGVVENGDYPFCWQRKTERQERRRDLDRQK